MLSVSLRSLKLTFISLISLTLRKLISFPNYNCLNLLTIFYFFLFILIMFNISMAKPLITNNVNKTTINQKLTTVAVFQSFSIEEKKSKENLQTSLIVDNFNNYSKNKINNENINK